MGSALTFMTESTCGFVLCEKKTYHIRVSGPAQSGKTSLVKWLKHRKFYKFSPTQGVEVDRTDYKDNALVLWDSRQHLEDADRPHHLDIRGIVYVVDSADPGRLRLANRALARLLKDLADVSVLLVFATKQDKPGALSVADIQTQLQLQSIVDKECGVFACSAKTGEGIEDGIDWMCTQLGIQDGNACACCNKIISHVPNIT